MPQLNPVEYFGFARGRGDASRNDVAPRGQALLLVPTDGRDMHFASAADKDTDWNVANPAQPTLYIHSETTPATDFLSIWHDATDAFINVDSGNLVLSPSGTVVVDTTGLRINDDLLLSLGTSDDARFSWETIDANANALLLQLPAGGAVNVPVLAIGQSIESVDLGLYNGVVDPRVAMFGVGAVTTGPIIEFRKARGTITSPTVVTTGDDLGTLDFYGVVAAAEWVRAASIRVDMTGTIATTRGPGNLSFNVATDAAPSVMTERVLITASGQINLTPATDMTLANGTGLIVGATAQVLAGGLAEVQVLGTAFGTDSAAILGLWAADANPPQLAFVKSRNATIGSFTVVANGDQLGQIRFYADDGVDYDSYAADIVCEIDGTPGSNDTPGRLLFRTTADGSASATERMRINADGSITVANGAPKLTLGTASTFSITQPTNALVMRSGTAPAGAIATAAGLFSTDTVMQKIIANGTVSNVET